MPQLTRREGLGLAGALGVAAAASGQAKAAAPGFVTSIDFKNPEWNRDTFARIDMDLNPDAEKVGWFRGTVSGVRDNEAVRPLFMIEGFSVVRSRRQEDGSWRRLLREIGFYRDLRTGEILKTWRNPYTNEDVRVVPIANDPFNYNIGAFWPDPPSYGGLNTAKPPRRPLLLDWTDGPDGALILSADINLYYPAALQPDKWPRESAGRYNRVSEFFNYVVKRRDVENPAVTSLPMVGSWSRITSWLPWMLMGQAPGSISYACVIATRGGGVGDLPPDLAAAARALDPKWLHAPTEDYGPSLSSLENYAREQTPAPVPAGWTPPQPPPPPAAPTAAPSGTPG